MTESRSELIQWVNDLLNTSFTRVEQLGSGAAWCQIVDSIYGNVPMSKVNFSAKQEWEFLPNYKVLQEAFKRNKIDKPIPVERLVRCKMQDNLEFLQWIKKFWDTNYPGTPYDPDARRQGQAAAPPPLHGAVAVGQARGVTASSSGGAAPRATAGATRGARTSAGTTARATTGVRRTAAGAGAGAKAAAPGAEFAGETIHQLTAQMDEMRVSVDSLERERDFYFGKLRDIEILVTGRLDHLESPDYAPEEGAEERTLKEIQSVLYAVDEGFEVPEGQEPAVDEAETF